VLLIRDGSENPPAKLALEVIRSTRRLNEDDLDKEPGVGVTRRTFSERNGEIRR